MYRAAFVFAAVPLLATAVFAQTSPRTAASALARPAVKGWDGKVQGKQIVVPVEFAFDNPADYDAFAAGKLPIDIALTSGASGNTFRFAAALVREGLRPSSDRGRVVVYLLVSSIAAPVWDAEGCIEESASADNGPGGNGVAVTLRLARCGGGTARVAGNPITGIVVKGGHNAAAMAPGGPIPNIIVKGGQNPTKRTAGGPIGGIIVKGGKNPGGNMRVTPWPSYLGDDGEARLRGELATTGMTNVTIPRLERGSGCPKQQCF